MKENVFTGLALLTFVFALYIGLGPEGIRDAPDVTVKAMDGKTITLGSKNKRPVLVTFWATSCTTCIAEIPDLASMYSDFKNDGFQVLGISMYYDKPVDVHDMVKARGIPYPIVNDVQKKLAKAFGLKAMVTPSTFLISPNGRIVFQKVGKLDFKLLRRKVVYYLKHQKSKVANH